MEILKSKLTDEQQAILARLNALLDEVNKEPLLVRLYDSKEAYSKAIYAKKKASVDNWTRQD